MVTPELHVDPDRHRQERARGRTRRRDAAGGPAADAGPGARKRRSKPAPQPGSPTSCQSGLDVKPARESNIINISWTGRSPAEAARVANAFAQAYMETSLELRTDTGQEVRRLVRRAGQGCAGQAGEGPGQAVGVPADSRASSPPTNGATTKPPRLTELSQQLHGRAGPQPARRRECRLRRLQSPLVNNMRADVAKLEAKVQEGAATMGSATIRRCSACRPSCRPCAARLAAEIVARRIGCRLLRHRPARVASASCSRP